MFREIPPQNKPKTEQAPMVEPLENRIEKPVPETENVILFDQSKRKKKENGSNEEDIANQEQEGKIFSEDELVNSISGDSNKKAAFRALVNESDIPWDKLGSSKAFSNPGFLKVARELTDEYLKAWRGTDSGKESRIKDCRERFKGKLKEAGIKWEEEGEKRLAA